MTVFCVVMGIFVPGTFLFSLYAAIDLRKNPSCRFWSHSFICYMAMPVLGGPIDFIHGFKNENMQPVKNHDPTYEKLMQAYNYCFSAVTVWAFLFAALSDLKFPVKDSWYIIMVLFFLLLFTTSFLLNDNEESIEHKVLSGITSVFYLFAPAALTLILIYSLSKWGILCTSATAWIFVAVVAEAFFDFLNVKYGQKVNKHGETMAFYCLAWTESLFGVFCVWQYVKNVQRLRELQEEREKPLNATSTFTKSSLTDF